MNIPACPQGRQSRNRLPELEWILLLTVVAVGILGGWSVARHSLASELVDLAEVGGGLNVKPEAEAEAESEP
jgi:hypothetical protein